MVNRLENEFYTRFLFKIYALPQDVGFLLNIATIFFGNLRPVVRGFFISEGEQVPQRLPTETNHQGKQSLLLVRNSAVEAEKDTRAIKSAIKPAGGSLHPRTFMSMLGGSPSIKISGWGGRF